MPQEREDRDGRLLHLHCDADNIYNLVLHNGYMFVIVIVSWNEHLMSKAELSFDFIVRNPNAIYQKIQIELSLNLPKLHDTR